MSDRPQETSERYERANAPSGRSALPFRELVERLPVGAYICDAEGLITYFNERAVRLWGRAPRLNDPVDRYCGSFRLFAPDGTPIPHGDCWMARALKTGKEWNGEEIVIERPDGNRVWALAHANPLFDESGRVIGAVNVLVDTSDRRQADQTRALLAAIVESSDDAIISKTLEGQIVTWNGGAERLFGYSAQEAVGQSILLVIPAERQHEEPLILERIRRGERIDHYETVRVAKDGRRLDVSLTISPIRDRAGRIVGASKVARDVTARKRADEALLEADRRKDEFLATLAHELRNPLAPIRNSLEVLKLTGSLAGDAAEMHGILHRQVEQLVRLVDDLLEVARITRGKVELRKSRVEMATAIAGAIETSRPEIDAAGHQLSVELPDEPMTLEADPVRLAQIITNLLTNAAKYTPAGGRIAISARRDGDEAVVSVRDSGIGISAELLPHVFDMFTQGGSANSTAKGGLGIGLALARSFVELHGGRIEARSQGPGTGSEFIVRLPIDCPPDSNGHPAAREAACRPRLPVHRVLVVDDTHAAAYMLAKLLEALGQDVLTARTAPAALELVREALPDLVISDIRMPEMDGYELARRMREVPGTTGMVLVALTGYGQERDRQRARQAGFDHHLVKPVSVESLEKLLAEVPARTAPAPAQQGAASRS